MGTKKKTMSSGTATTKTPVVDTVDDQLRNRAGTCKTGEISQRAVHQLLDFGNGLVVTGRADANHDPVIREDFEHLIRWDEYFPAVIEHRKAVPVLGALDGRLSALLFGLHLGFEAFELRQGFLIEHAGNNL